MAPITSGLLFGAQLGANYYFIEQFGAWAELGYRLCFPNLGGTIVLRLEKKGMKPG